MSYEEEDTLYRGRMDAKRLFERIYCFEDCEDDTHHLLGGRRRRVLLKVHTLREWGDRGDKLYLARGGPRCRSTRAARPPPPLAVRCASSSTRCCASQPAWRSGCCRGRASCCAVK